MQPDAARFTAEVNRLLGEGWKWRSGTFQTGCHSHPFTVGGAAAGMHQYPYYLVVLEKRSEFTFKPERTREDEITPEGSLIMGYASDAARASILELDAEQKRIREGIG